ncbi:MAG: ribulokinase, partial [Planctomycetes bacterium]|nr:ribulokinase [Planctomycetota bacterium]
MGDTQFALGFDFGTESVRVVVVDLRSGDAVGVSTRNYAHGVLDAKLPGGTPLPPDYALQYPQDWLDGAVGACKDALKQAAATPEQIVGIGVDFTSCTMLPCKADGTPLCLVSGFGNKPLAWPKLWKHHGAKSATDRINRVARERNEPWLARYGGTVGLEWFFPKMLETLEEAPEVFDAAEVWIEAGDWFVWQLVSGPFPRCAPSAIGRSTCQAGYKGLWSPDGGFPSREFLKAVHPRLGDVVQTKMPGRLVAPGRPAGALAAAAADAFGLRPGIPVSAAIIDAHAGVPGAGVADAGTMVLVLGTSACQMLMDKQEHLVPGIAGIVRDGILPGFYGYEAGQASVGDAFGWFVDALGLSHETLARDAAKLGPGSRGVLAIDWLNGCRTPLMDGRLSGAFIGLKLDTTPAQMYRALIEATGFGLRRIVDDLEANGVAARDFVACGGLASKAPLLMQVYADVLGREIRLAASDQSVALGAAILGALAAEPALT